MYCPQNTQPSVSRLLIKSTQLLIRFLLCCGAGQYEVYRHAHHKRSQEKGALSWHDHNPTSSLSSDLARAHQEDHWIVLSPSIRTRLLSRCHDTRAILGGMDKVVCEKSTQELVTHLAARVWTWSHGHTHNRYDRDHILLSAPHASSPGQPAIHRQCVRCLRADGELLLLPCAVSRTCHSASVRPGTS